MKELEKKAVQDLLDLFTKFQRTGLTKELSLDSKKVYDELIPANTLLSKDINFVVVKLFSLAYPNVDESNKINEEEVSKIIKILNTLNLKF